MLTTDHKSKLYLTPLIPYCRINCMKGTLTQDVFDLVLYGFLMYMNKFEHGFEFIKLSEKPATYCFVNSLERPNSEHCKPRHGGAWQSCISACKYIRM